MTKVRLMRKIISVILAGVLLLASQRGYAQNLRQEVEERGVEAIEAESFRREAAVDKRKKAIEGVLRKHIKVTYGYDTNPLLGTSRTSDDFESLRLGMDYRRTFAERHQYNVGLNVSQQNYNEITQLSNTLGNISLDYKLALTKAYILGIGHNLTGAYYEKSSDSEFMLNKSYINFQHRISPKFFHKIQYEYGLKHYDEAFALLSSTSTYEDNRRKDVSNGVVYSIGYMLRDRLSMNISLGYSRNDSNSDFENYYDYESTDLVPRLSYQFNDKLSSTLSYSFKFRRYEDRLVSALNDEQVDRISRVDLGFNYDLNDSHSFNLNYSYNGSDSNNPTSDYAGNSIEAGWRFNF